MRATSATTSNGRPEDGSRSEHDFLCRCVETAIKAGARTINIPDTRRLCGARGIRRTDRHAVQPRAEHRQGDRLGALPQRSGPGRRQFAGRRRRRRAPGRMHHQRAGRAGRQCGDGRDRHGAAHAPRPHAVQHRHRQPSASPRPRAWSPPSPALPVQPNKAIVGANAFAHEVRHPPGRHAEACRHLRDHDAGIRRPQPLDAGHGQAFRPPRLQDEAEGAGLRARRQCAGRRLPPLQGAGRQEEGRLRRGHRRPRRRQLRAQQRTHPLRLAAGDRRLQGAAEGRSRAR